MSIEACSEAPLFSQTTSREPLRIPKKVKQRLGSVLEGSTLPTKLVLSLPGLKDISEGP